jgi:DNA-binding LytR/AlgR family response regulator
LQDTPDILFLDIRLPGRSGLEVAAAVIERWPQSRPAPLIVFVTAFEEFAIDAFEHEAVDFLQKPVTRQRLAKTVMRLQARLQTRLPMPVIDQLKYLFKTMGAEPAPVAATADTSRPQLPMLDTLHVGIGTTVRIVSLQDVLYLEAADKYVNVVTSEWAGLMRMSMRELLARIDPAIFLQIHRGVVVNRKTILCALRDDTGRMTLQLRGTNKTVRVSRAFAHLFRPM